MFHLITKLPSEILVCCSGGVDSIAAAHFLRRKHTVTIYYFHHLTPQADLMQDGVEKFCKDFSLPLICKKANKKFQSEQDFRSARLEFLINNPFNAVTAHHLQDAVEQNFLNFCRGHIRKIPMNIVSLIGQSKVYHPFLTTDKSKLQNYAIHNKLEKYITTDLTNFDPNYCRRNWIRNEILPALKSKQIGIDKIVRKQYLKFVSDHVSKNCPPSITAAN